MAAVGSSGTTAVAEKAAWVDKMVDTEAALDKNAGWGIVADKVGKTCCLRSSTIELRPRASIIYNVGVVAQESRDDRKDRQQTKDLRHWRQHRGMGRMNLPRAKSY